MNKFKFLLIFIILTSCGYTPIFEKNINYNFKIGKVEFLGEKNINRELNQLLESFKKNNSINVLNLEITSSKSNYVITKDKKGNPSSFKIEIIIICKIINTPNKDKFKKELKREVTYNFLENQFETDLYKSNLEKNILSQIKKDLIMYLNLLNNDL
jgi:hypothetical protein